MKKVINYLLQGVLYVAPLGLTAYIIYSIFSFIDGVLQNSLLKIYDIKIPGLGIFILLIVLFLIGVIGNSIIAKPIKKILLRIINNIPILKFIYNAFNDLFSAFVGKEKKFNKPVLVKVNVNSDLEKLGFITEDNLSLINEKDKVAVYFPHSYNFSGELFIVPKENIRVLNLDSSDVMKFIVSAGLVRMNQTKP